MHQKINRDLISTNHSETETNVLNPYVSRWRFCSTYLLSSPGHLTADQSVTPVPQLPGWRAADGRGAKPHRGFKASDDWIF